MPPMIESHVDLTYRGLPLGKRVKLTQVRPSTGYLETAVPMPVGTAIGITTDDGVIVEATVSEICEQVTGSDKTPGMVVKPKLEADAARSWWKARVEMPDVVKVEPAPAIGIVRARRKSEGAVPELVDDGRNTGVMDAIDPASSGDLPRDTQVIDVVPFRDSDPPIVDDGKRTVAMAAVDLEALGLTSSSGTIPIVTGDDKDDKDDDDKGGGRKKRKRR